MSQRGLSIVSLGLNGGPTGGSHVALVGAELLQVTEGESGIGEAAALLHDLGVDEGAVLQET